MKNSFLLKWVFFFFAVSFYLGTQSVTFSEPQGKDTTVSKTPPAEKKQPPNESDEPLPEIFLEPKEHDGGVVYEGTVVTHSFAVKNKGKGELHIKSVKPG